MSLEVDIKKTLPGFTLRMRFTADSSEVLGFLGPSGSGKSMTLKCIAGIETPDEGAIVLDGVPLFDSDRKINVPPQKRKTGYLFQNAALFPNMTAEQNVMCVLGSARDRRRRRSVVAEMFALLGLDGLEERYPSELSGGQQQRVALARVLLSEPRVLLLDEPFSALDSHLRWKLEQDLGAILSRFDGPAIFVSHNRDEVYRLCPRIAVVSSGSVAAIGDRLRVFSEPRSLEACLLTGCKNVSASRAASPRAVYAEDWDLELDCGGRPVREIKFVGVRAHDIVLTDAQGMPNTFEYEVAGVLPDPFSHILLIRKKGSPGAKPLRLELGRDRFAGLEALPKRAHIPPEKLILLEN